MQHDQLKSICEHFLIRGEVVSFSTISSGHINDTFLANCSNKKKYVLQKLNTSVFKDYVNIVENKVIVSEHLNTFYKKVDSKYKSIQFIKTHKESFYLNDNSCIWMVMDYIENSQVFDKVTDEHLVFEAGKLYGNFVYSTQTLDSSKITETLPDFHSVPLRLEQFKKAIENGNSVRITHAKKWIELVNKHGSEMCELWQLKQQGVLPARITHNDTKLSNVLFSQSKPIEGLAVIDLDTVMPGLVHFDFGDSVRSICSCTTEDDNNLDNVHINLHYYQSFCKGFAIDTKRLLNQTEIQYLPLGVLTLIFIMGLRFLTDYLSNDTYYKTTYDNHNLARASNQFTLFLSALENIEEIKVITKNAFNLHNIP